METKPTLLEAARFAASVIQAQGLYDLSEKVAYQKLQAALAAQATPLENLLEQIRAERTRQDEKWGEQNHRPADWLAILGEEVGEANKAYVEANFADGSLAELANELIQVAAVAVSIIESLLRQGDL